MYLRKQGYRVLQAEDAERGLEYIARERPKLAIVDVGLPGELDGLDVCRKLGAEHGPPVVLLTARDDEVDRVLGLELGADDYVTKPFSPRELVARVRAVLRRTEGAGRNEPVVMADRTDLDRHRPARGHPRRRARRPDRPGVRPARLSRSPTTASP